MTCAHSLAASFETCFAIDAARIVFGHGALAELGGHVASLGCRRVALFTDARVGALSPVFSAKKSLQNANIDFAIYDAVHVEPTDASFMDAARFAREGRFDGFVSVGGGSTIDTCKAASLYATYPAEFLDYVNAPVGGAKIVPGALLPHVACPTTCGTGSETTGIAVCDVLALKAKTGIASARLRPSLALVDPTCTYTLPSEVVAASGFDVLCHALESYTARAFTARERANARPMSQGRNPWSDIGSTRALELASANLVRAVSDASDREARDALAWAATLAGIAFGNAGVHVPHAMAYAVAGLVREFRMPGYPPDEPMIPHGVSVVVGAPSAFRFTAPASPARHIDAARLLGEDIRSATDDDAGEVLSRALERTMRAAQIPVGLRALGYERTDAPSLARGTIVQKRLLANAPREVAESDLASIFERALA
jgi:alcohol dehydrogenase class IV